MTEREILTHARDELRELVSTSEQNFEKQLSYVAGGGLVLTFVLVEKLIGDVSANTWPWLFCTWVGSQWPDAYWLIFGLKKLPQKCTAALWLR
jgi:hypothetical protein